MPQITYGTAPYGRAAAFVRLAKPPQDPDAMECSVYPRLSAEQTREITKKLQLLGVPFAVCSFAEYCCEHLTGFGPEKAGGAFAAVHKLLHPTFHEKLCYKLGPTAIAKPDKPTTSAAGASKDAQPQAKKRKLSS